MQKEIIFITDGTLGQNAFDQYSLQTLLQLLKNNSISFNAIYLKGPESIYSQEIDFLCRETGGMGIYLYRPEGLAKLIEHIKAKQSGCYVIQYNSMNDSDFGRTYLPVEIQTFLFARSGRDESGYFAPIEY